MKRNNQTTPANQAAQYERQLRLRVHEEQKNLHRISGEKWSHIGGGLYNGCRIGYFIVSLYILFFDLVMALGCVLDLVDVQRFSDSKSILVVLSVLMGLLVAALILIAQKKTKAFTALLISLPTSVASAIITYRWYTNQGDVSKAFEDGVYTKYIFCNLPVILLPVFAFILWWIIRRDTRAENEVYDRLIRKLYAENVQEDGGLLSDEQWAQILQQEAEKTVDPSQTKKKRSARVRQQKEQQRKQQYATRMTDPVDAVCPLCRQQILLQRDDEMGICSACGKQIEVRSAVRLYQKMQQDID